jgi:8-oxo-dGTP pyrophosphatase MutT (NUDIX family)/geranylgeranyl pyrophosphate synthase
MSEARFVCAVIRDRDGRILLERRSRNVDHFAELLCTPGGAVDGGESSEEAIRREIREETGLELGPLEALPAVVRCSGTIAFFVTDRAELVPRIHEPEFIDELAWYAIDSLPERLVLESVLGLAPLFAQQPLATVVDRTFSALFYAHMEPVLRSTWPVDATSPVLFHTINNTPWRKFHGALPLLASGGDADALLPSLAAEVLFSFFYVCDDLLDGKTARYGAKTALGAFGSAAATDFVARFDRAFATYLGAWPDTSARRRIEANAAGWLAQLRHQQSERRRGTATTMEQYEAASAVRTAFLGQLWELAADAAGDAPLARLWREIYPLCAVIGQLKNDLRELDPASESYGEDARTGTRTAVTMRLRESVAGTAVSDELVLRCRALIAQVVDAVRGAAIDDDTRVIIESWLHLQFENELEERVAITDVSPAAFLQSVARIAERIDFFNFRRRTSPARRSPG